MKNDQSLFGKTFDQQLEVVGQKISASDIAPNVRIPVSIVLETINSRVLMTVYDDKNKILFQREDINFAEKTSPTRLAGAVVFEPIDSTVRVTARDEDHRVLWGYVASKETASQWHCSVASYETFQKLLGNELAKHGAIAPVHSDVIQESLVALEGLEKTIHWLRESMKVEKKTDATKVRASAILRIVSDARRQIILETESLKGMKSRVSP